MRSCNDGAVRSLPAAKKCSSRLRHTTWRVSWKRSHVDARKPMSWSSPMLSSPPLTGATADLPSSASYERARIRTDSHLQRAEGGGRMVLGGARNGARIVEVFQRSPIRIMIPRVAGSAVEEAVFINTSGGIAGGDRLDCNVTALAEASIAVTSQAAEKVYRALNEPARIATKLKACEAAKLAWLPQETIIFNWARLSRKTEIDVASGAELLALEWLVLGRAAHGEDMVGGHISDTWHVKKDGRLIWADCFRATDGTFPNLKRNALLSSCKAIGTLIYFGPDFAARLEFFRGIAASLKCHCAATCVSGLIVVRLAAPLSSDLSLALRTLLQQFSQQFGPGPFRVPKMWSC